MLYQIVAPIINTTAGILIGVIANQISKRLGKKE